MIWNDQFMSEKAKELWENVIVQNIFDKNFWNRLYGCGRVGQGREGPGSSSLMTIISKAIDFIGGWLSCFCQS